MLQALGLGALLAGLYYMTAFDSGDSLTISIKSNQATLDSKKTELAKLKAIDSEKEKLATQRNSLKQKFEDLAPILPRDLSTTDLSKVLVEEARRAGADNIKLGAVGQPSLITTDDPFQFVQGEIVFEATFTNTMKFLGGLSRWPRLLLLTDFEAQPRGSERLEPRPYAQEPWLSVKVGMRAVRYTPVVDAKKPEGT